MTTATARATVRIVIGRTSQAGRRGPWAEAVRRDYHDNCKPGWVPSVVTLPRPEPPYAMRRNDHGHGARGTGAYVMIGQPEVCGLRVHAMAEEPLLLDRVGWFILPVKDHGVLFQHCSTEQDRGWWWKFTPSYSFLLFLGSHPLPHD